MRLIFLAVLVAVLALQAPAWAGEASGGAAAQQSVGNRYHVGVGGMT